VLTCASTSLVGPTASCVNPLLNGVKIRSGGLEAYIICSSVALDAVGGASATSTVSAPYYLWNGTQWAPGTGTALGIDTLNCPA
jgi:hypothetical protein